MDVNNDLDKELDDVLEPIVDDTDDVFGDEPIGTEKTDDLFNSDTQKEPSGNEVINSLLTQKGFGDSKIKIIDEDNNEKEISFYELPLEEQLEILSNQDTPDYSESEVSLIEKLRSENISWEDYLEKYKQELIESLDVSQNESYEIDNYSDEELFLIDLKSKYDLTEEELTAELDKELQNKELFEKKTKRLRDEYKELEEIAKQQEQQKFEETRKKEYDNFVGTMTDVANKSSDFYGIELENEEKEAVLSYLLDLDDQGTSEFYKSLNTPEKLYEAAWFLKYGKEAFDALKNAYEDEIEKIKKDKPQVVVHKDKTEKSIYDIDF